MLIENSGSLPKKIYKYRNFDKYGLHILKQNQIYFSNLDDLNDPFECRYILTSDDANINQEWIKTLSSVHENYAKWLEQEPQKFEKIMNERLSKLFTFCSLSETNDDILAFSHYGGCHRGFCIGFNTEYLPFSETTKVNYSDTPPSINIKNPGERAGVDVLLTKAKTWEYEKEWRIIHFRDQKGWQDFPPEAITEIIIGCKMSPENEKELCDLVKSRLHKVDVFKAHIKKDKYALRLEKIIVE